MAIFKKNQLEPQNRDPIAKGSPSPHPKPKMQFHEDSHFLRHTAPSQKCVMIERVRKQFLPVVEPALLDDSPSPENWVPPITKEDVAVDLATYRNDQKRSVDQALQSVRERFVADLDGERKRSLDIAQKEGRKAGEIEGRRIFETQSEALLVAVNELVRYKHKVLEGAREDVLELAIVAAQKIIQAELTLQPDVILAIVREAINRITDKDRVSIRVNPADHDVVVAGKDDIVRHLGDVKHVDILPDVKIARGGCIIETRLGFVDSSIETKVETLQSLIRKAYQEESLDRLVSEMDDHEIDA